MGGELSAERKAAWAAWVADYRRQLQTDSRPDEERQAAQDTVNPAYIPRNHVMQTAIAAAEKGNSSEVTMLSLQPTCVFLSLWYESTRQAGLVAAVGEWTAALHPTAEGHPP